MPNLWLTPRQVIRILGNIQVARATSCSWEETHEKHPTPNVHRPIDGCSARGNDDIGRWQQRTGAGSRSPKIDTGDTAWMLASTALVMLMTPALAFFYGGLVRAKNFLEHDDDVV